MRLEQALKIFKNKDIAKICDVDKSVPARWKDGIVPINHAWKLERASKGKLSMRLSDYR